MCLKLFGDLAVLWVLLFTSCDVCLADHLQGMNKLRQSLTPNLLQLFMLNIYSQIEIESSPELSDWTTLAGVY